MRSLAPRQKLVVLLPCLMAIFIPSLSVAFRHARHPPSDGAQGFAIGLCLGFSLLSVLVLIKDRRSAE